jgi:Fe-S-cluster containining protein
VWFTEPEGQAMADALQMQLPDFLRLFARQIDGRWSLTERAGPRGMDCVLLDRESQPGKALCRVYQARPAQCRTWPFWQRNLVSRDAWQRAAADTPCHGMGSGNFFPADAIVERLRAEQAGEAGARW